MAKEKRKISLFGYLFRFVNGIVMVSLLIAYFSRYISPNTLWFPAFFGLSYPFLFIINLYFVFHWLFSRRWFVLYPLIVLILGFSLPSYYLGFGSNAEYVGEQNSFKIMSYNVHDFDYYSQTYGKGNGAVDKIISHIKKENPDIICFQEFYSNPKKPEKDNFLRFKKELNYKYIARYKYNNRTSYMFIVIYSRFPIIHDDYIRNAQGNKDITGVYADVKFNNAIFRVYNVHLNSTQISSQAYLIQEDYDVTKEEDVERAASGAKKIAGRMRSGYKKRALQAELLRKHIAASPYPVVFVGDFNDTPCSYSYEEISNGLTDAFVTAGKGLSTTYRGVYPAFRIDYILYDDYFSSHSYRREKIEASDHFPISTVLILNEKGDNDGK